MRFNYKIFPLTKPHPAYPGMASTWMPVLPIRLSYKHGPQTTRFDALIDSGATDCMFHGDIGVALGIVINSGPKGTQSGIVPGVGVDVYYHPVSLWVGADRIKITAAFAPNLSVAAILGRHGFFENFIITFDPSNNPPGFEITRLGRA